MFPKHKCPTAKSVWNSCTLCLLSGRARWALGFKSSYAALCLVIQSCLTLCDPMDCSPPGSSVYGDSPGKNEGVGCHALLQMKAPKSSQMHVDTHIHTPHCKHNPFYFFWFSCQRIQLSMTLSWINQQSVNWLNNNNKKKHSNSGISKYRFCCINWCPVGCLPVAMEQRESYSLLMGWLAFA